MYTLNMASTSHVGRSVPLNAVFPDPAVISIMYDTFLSLFLSSRPLRIDPSQLKYVYHKPAYRPDTLLFIASLFGIAFIILGNMAGNAISFGVRILEASNTEVTNGAVRGIAIAASLIACFIHTFSRKGGILLSSLFAIIKICMLLFIIVTAICYGTGKFPNIPGRAIDRDETLSQNLAPSHAFSESSSSANGYAQAFLAIIFAFGGFEQPNYVLGEINRPYKTYPIAMTASVTIVCVLYMAVNVSYVSIQTACT